MASRFATFWLVAGVLLGAPAARAAPPEAPELVVARLRVEVDELSASIADERRRAQERLQGLRVERAELERQLRLEQVRARTLARIEAQDHARADALDDTSAARLEPIREALALAESYVQDTLPFEREGRLRVLAAIRADLAASRPDPSNALSRLWRFVEEEEALGREVSRAQQPVSLDGERQLVDVVRLGMAAMYLRTAAGEYGWAKRGPAGWGFERLHDPAPKAAVAALFASFDENRRFGPQHLVMPDDAP